MLSEQQQGRVASELIDLTQQQLQGAELTTSFVRSHWAKMVGDIMSHPTTKTQFEDLTPGMQRRITKGTELDFEKFQELVANEQ